MERITSGMSSTPIGRRLYSFTSIQPQGAHRMYVNVMLSLPDDMHDPPGRIMTLYNRNVQQYCSSVHDIRRNQCRTPRILRKI